MSFLKGLTKFLSPSDAERYSTLSGEPAVAIATTASPNFAKPILTKGHSLKTQISGWATDRLGALGYSSEIKVAPNEKHSPLMKENDLADLMEDLADDLQETVRSTRRIHSVKATVEVDKGNTSITFECLGQFENSLLEYAEEQRLRAIEKRYRKSNTLKFEINQASYYVSLKVEIIEQSSRLGFSAIPETEDNDDD